MKIVQKALGFVARKINTLSQSQNIGLAEGEATPGMPELVRAAPAEGAVLLKNNGVLPVSKEQTVSLFGRVQVNTFFVGYGSGGDVNAPYKISYLDGIKNCENITLNTQLADIYTDWCAKNPVFDAVWGMWPRYLPEMPLSDETVKNAANQSDTALVFIGRSSGEDRENVLKEGSYYLTKDEIKMLRKVTNCFKKVAVILNIGSIIDFSWLDEFGDKIGAVMVVWQGGMESGNAVADLLCGRVTPCGKLTDTVAKSYKDYPSSSNFGKKKFTCYEEDIFVGYRYFSTFDKEKVVYPFGFGLSYARFDLNCLAVNVGEENTEVTVRVKNISDKYSGKEVVQVYYGAEGTKLVKPGRQLVAFEKTKLLAPGEEQDMVITYPNSVYASYDDFGVTGYKYAWVQEKGSYKIYVGTDAVSAWNYASFECETKLINQLTQCAAPTESFNRIDSLDKNTKHPVPLNSKDIKSLIKKNIPADIELTGDKGYKLSDVRSGKVLMNDFIAQLSLDELEAISRGDYTMHSKLGAEGNAGAFGGVLESMRNKGITPVVTTDGPSGIRLKASCSLLPIGTLLACTWNEALVEQLYTLIGNEMLDRGSDVLLAPGMNIHRNPLCGRNFEYFSEDPLISGKIAAAVVRGIQSSGLSACPKHFACNNQETNRCHNDSRVSERALREIYLKGFEICVKEASPKCLMTSYNKINGVWGHYNYELCQSILRDEWGFEGCVMTDWWMRKSRSPEFPAIRDNAYRVRAGVDVLMPGGERVNTGKPDGTLLETYGKPDGMTLGEMQRTAKHVCNLILRLPEKNMPND